jgi:uncharacterized membrane protein
MTVSPPLFATTVRALEDAAALDRPADTMASALDAALRPAVWRALHGTWLGHPVHPLMITLPIGCWTSASLLDVTGRSPRSAQQLVGAGIVAALGAAVTGMADWRSTTGAARRLGVVHAASNSVALGLYVTSWRLRVKGKHRAGAAVALVGAVAMSAGGYLGGHMSYALGANVASVDPVRIATG